MGQHLKQFLRRTLREATTASLVACSLIYSAAAGQLGSCPGVDDVETNLNHASSSAYYLPGLKLIVLNRVILDKYALPVQKFIFAHECAHSDPAVRTEDDADCAAAKRGVKEGWFGRSEIIQVCVHIGHMPMDAEHQQVSARCGNIRRCMSEPAREPARETARLTPLDRGGP